MKNWMMVCVGIAVLGIVAAGAYGYQSYGRSEFVAESADAASSDVQPAVSEAVYAPSIQPSDFTGKVDNRYFSLTPGKRLVYQADTEDGTERVEVVVTGETKNVMGIETAVVWDRVWLNGDLIEDTKDWYAQDGDGNVWYFGEDSVEMALGQVLNHAGSWEAGVDGAQPGMIMLASPKVGDSYRQEYYAGVAEDMGDVLSLNESVSTPYGKLDGCLKTRDWTPLEANADEHKYYCPSVGFAVLEVGLEDGERLELIGVGKNEEANYMASKQSKQTETEVSDSTEITKEEAEEIALKEVPGKVTGVAKEGKFGKIAMVVEIQAENGIETDVIVDLFTGEILGVET